MIFCYFCNNLLYDSGLKDQIHCNSNHYNNNLHIFVVTLIMRSDKFRVILLLMNLLFLGNIVATGHDFVVDGIDIYGSDLTGIQILINLHVS